MLLNIADLIGNFHPVIVHLPIGILLVAVLFEFLSRKEKYASLNTAVRISLLVGMFASVIACITGFLLSKTDDYDDLLISRHQWFGIGAAVISIVTFYLHKKNYSHIRWLMLFMALLIIITGHLGGSITHGSDYLTKSFSSQAAETKIKPIANIQEAELYADIIQPIFKSRCYSCHGPNKQKGKLRLDEKDFILKGGKEGVILIAGKADESELIRRILLPLEDEDHMPPKEKPQLTKNDLDLIHWWVSTGADFNKKIKEIPANEKISPLLLALQSGTVKNENKISDIPAKEVKKADEVVIQKLKALGVVIVPVAVNSNYLSANFITADFTDKDLQLLEPLKQQLIWLNVGNTKITDSAMHAIGQLSGLTKLYLQNTNVTDWGLAKLSGIGSLQYLNLTGLKATANGILQLKSLKNLQQIFLYKTGITAGDYQKLKATFPEAEIDTGGYRLQMLDTDTMMVKQKEYK